MNSWRVIEGDCRDVLRSLEAGSVHTCATSPPYFGLRDYGHDGQIGLEPTPDEFVAALVDVFREVRRVLRDDGTVWLNLGDSYAGSWGAQSRVGNFPSAKSTLTTNNGRGPKAGDKYCALGAAQIAAHPKGQTRTGSIPPGASYKPKDLLMVPAMAALALRADGWFLRDEIIWHKPAPMPTSARDRTCRAHEVVYLLSKRKAYFYDQQAIAEPSVSDHPSGNGYARPEQIARGGRGSSEGWTPEQNPTRVKRSVWTVGTANYPEAHFATFPPKLIEPCILAGCPERACAECGAPWVRVVEPAKSEPDLTQRSTAHYDTTERYGAGNGGNGGFDKLAAKMRAGEHGTRTVGFEPSCTHDVSTTTGVVLDPFAGAGTTGMVALRHGRSFVGIELNPTYAQLARDRIIADCPLHNTFNEAAA